MADTEESRPRNKVARIIDEHDLEGLGSDLEKRWTGDGVDRMSLRDLATYFNKRLLESVLLDAGMSALEDDVETIYQNLTDDSVSTGVRTETRGRLKENGIDVNTVEQNFVTYQAIRSYLTEYRDAEYEEISDQEKIDKDIESIQRLLTRTHSVTEDRIEKLGKTGRIDIDEFEVFIDTQVLCQKCGTQYSVVEFFEQRGCDCLANQ